MTCWEKQQTINHDHNTQREEYPLKCCECKDFTKYDTSCKHAIHGQHRFVHACISDGFVTFKALVQNYKLPPSKKNNHCETKHNGNTIGFKERTDLACRRTLCICQLGSSRTASKQIAYALEKESLLCPGKSREIGVYYS